MYIGVRLIMHARLIVSGNVQGVGYRTLVRQISKRMRVTGIVRNLPEGDVEIYCQCSDKETLDKFIEQVDVKATTDNVFAVHVDSITSYNEGEANYGEPDTDFKSFKIDYGMEIDQFQRESLERSEIGILLLGGTISGIGDVRSEVGGVRTDIKAMHTDLKDGSKETKEGLGRVEGAISGMHSDMNDRFDTLDDKYGAISQQMNTLTIELQTSTKSLVSLTEKIGALIDEKLAE